MTTQVTMRIRHVGKRPIHPTHKEMINNKEWVVEVYPSGAKKFWTDRTLQSGCNNVIGETKFMGELIYCPFCDEYFGESQFVKEEE